MKDLVWCQDLLWLILFDFLTVRFLIDDDSKLMAILFLWTTPKGSFK